MKHVIFILFFVRKIFFPFFTVFLFSSSVYADQAYCDLNYGVNQYHWIVYQNDWCGSTPGCGGCAPGAPLAPPPSVPTNPFGTPPPINPIADNLVPAAAALGLGLLAGIGALVGAPVLAAVSAGAAVVAAVGAAVGLAMGGTSQGAIDSVHAPLAVTLAPVSSPPVPEVGATSAPSVVVDAATGQFKPGGGNLADGSGASGGWSQGGASGEWAYVPPATVDNPTPAAIARITDNGYGVAQQTAPTSSGTSSGSVYVQRYSDGTVVVTGSASVPVSTSSGTPSTLDASVTTAYAPDGTKLPGDPVVAVGDRLGNGELSNAGSGLSVTNSGLGSGTGSGVGPGTGSGGSCSSGDCATESTQRINKGLLQDIKDFFTGTAAASADPTARTGADIKGASVDGSGVFTGLRGWRLPSHASQCPTSSFAWNGNTYTFDAHCQLANDHFALFNGVMVLIFSISALFIVLRA